MPYSSLVAAHKSTRKAPDYATAEQEQSYYDDADLLPAARERGRSGIAGLFHRLDSTRAALRHRINLRRRQTI